MNKVRLIISILISMVVLFMLLVIMVVQVGICVDGVWIWFVLDYIRLVLDMVGQVVYNIFLLEKFDCLVIDLKNINLKVDFDKFDFFGSLIQCICSVFCNGIDLCVVFDLKNEIKF